MKKMYNVKVRNISTLKVNEATEGETIEDRLERLTTTDEPIQAESPIIYTERKDGVLPQYDIRTDKWSLANEAADIMSKNRLLRRQAANDKAKQELKNEADRNETKGQSVDGTDPQK